MRVAREPHDQAAYDALCSEATSTHDLCADCYEYLGGDGAPWPEDEPKLAPYNSEPDAADVGGYVICGELEHPDYDDEAAYGSPYRCARCGVPLSEDDDG